ncbi:hypothetical protein NQZ79_g5604 [Umbelopsis isabellina]|nr:hypothetical protein NQZ79_g5604 [Umbelopsis isabellina]
MSAPCNAYIDHKCCVIGVVSEYGHLSRLKSAGGLVSKGAGSGLIRFPRAFFKVSPSVIRLPNCLIPPGPRWFIRSPALKHCSRDTPPGSFALGSRPY